MRFGFVVPYASPREFAEVAALGERHGWDAVFTWEAVWGEHAWVGLGAAAMVTGRIRLGTLPAPPPPPRPASGAAPPAGVGGRGPGRRPGRTAVACAGRALGRPAARHLRQ